MSYEYIKKYQEAKKVVENLSDEGRDGLIKYYIQRQDEAIEELKAELPRDKKPIGMRYL
jgi:hypothetical protein